ncbi:MAG: prepilin-type N-terminal cleavage/methylation domain-containing protein [Acidimicrobiales bacterium]
MNTDMSSTHVSPRLVVRARQWSGRTLNHDDRGFTLVELLIVIAVVPIIIGALAAGLIAVFSLQSGVANRLGDSSDAQVVAASFTKDVQGAISVTTSATPLCGSGTQLLGLEWGVSQEVISYDEVQSTASTYALVRNVCDAGPTTAVTSSAYLSYDLLAPCPPTDSPSLCSSLGLQPAPVAYDGTTVINTAGVTPVSTVGMTSLQFPIKEPKSSYQYQLAATPARGNSTTNLGGENLNTLSFCGFALPGTGTYASTMCFVGFTTPELEAAYPSKGNTCTSTDPGQQGVDLSVDVPGGYVMTFCLTVVPGSGESQSATNPSPLEAVSTPIGGGTCDTQKSGPCDWGQKSNGQGFLGNDNTVNGTPTPFYAGIGCPSSTPTLQSNVVTSSCIDPAIFQTTNGGLDTVTLSDIHVTDPQGDSATGYEVITVDAETIDPNGYVQWTSTSPASKPLPFNLVPNFSSSDLGNACNNVPSADTGAGNATGWSIDDGDTTVQIGGTNYSGDLTGLGTASVKCVSNWQTQAPYLRTGTAMLGITPPTVNGSAEPVTIQAVLKGEGYNAVAFGLLIS